METLIRAQLRVNNERREEVDLQNFQVEMMDENGHCIQGTVVDRLDDNYVIVDFHCMDKPLRRVLNQELFGAISDKLHLAVSQRDLERNGLRLGEPVHVLVQPESRRYPLTWYPGRVVYGSHDLSVQPSAKYFWVLIDVALAPKCHRVMLFGLGIYRPFATFARIQPDFEIQHATRRRVSNRDFCNYILSVSDSVVALRSRLADPEQFLSWLVKTTCCKILDHTVDKVTLLRRCHDHAVANGEFWSGFQDYLRQPETFVGNFKMHPRWYGNLYRPLAVLPRNSTPLEEDVEFATDMPAKRRRLDRIHEAPAKESASDALLSATECRMPNELLARVFLLLDVDQQNYLSRFRNTYSSNHACPIFPVRQFVRFSKLRGIKLPHVVIGDAWLLMYDGLGYDCAKASIADVTSKFTVRNVKISTSADFENGQKDFLGEPKNATQRLEKHKSKSQLLEFFDGLWPEPPNEKKQALQRVFDDFSKWSESQRRAVGRHIARLRIPPNTTEDSSYRVSYHL